MKVTILGVIAGMAAVTLARPSVYKNQYTLDPKLDNDAVGDFGAGSFKDGRKEDNGAFGDFGAGSFEDEYDYDADYDAADDVHAGSFESGYKGGKGNVGDFGADSFEGGREEADYGSRGPFKVGPKF
ncbi:hypothetical protein EV182_007021, partial [Spiromyces aspiralis]